MHKKEKMEPLKCNEFKDTRSGFGQGLLEASEKNKDIYALCADLTGSLKMGDFVKAFPERFIQVGLAEANMVGIAAGLALTGKIPVLGTFACFASGRVYDQLRVSVAYSQLNVKIAASHAGLTVGEDGATHQMMEDIALMKALPGMVVMNPCDYNQTRLATLAALAYQGPVYIRFGRPAVPNFTPKDFPFEIGKAIVMNKGTDLTIFATGHLVYPALEAAYQLYQQNISAEVINIHTIKPLDEETILQSVKKTNCVVTAEEHLLNGGMGDSVCQLLSRKLPTPVEMVGVDDQFGETGKPDELMKLYGLDVENIVQASLRAITRKKIKS